MTSPFQAGFCSCFCSGCCPPAEHKVPCIQGQLQLSVLQASHVAQPQLLLEQGGGEGPPCRSCMQLAGGLESLSSFIEMLPQPCPSSGFQSL